MSNTTSFAENEFARLFAQHARSLYAYLASLLINTTDTEEVFQDTCCVLWSKFHTFDRDRDFLAWARGIGYLEVCNFRRRAKRPLALGEDVVDLLAEDSSRSSDTTDRELALESCLQKLSEEDAALIRLRYYDRHSPKRISAILGNSIHSVYRSLGRVHDRLLQCIESTLHRSKEDVANRITT
jgi:RNA polymerase sigma-70 factor (ECF subfamily)